MAGIRCQLLVGRTSSNIWAISLLMFCNAVLGKVKDNISFESFVELHNVLFSSSAELFPVGVLKRAAEKTSRVFHNEAIRKVVSMDKPWKKPLKHLQFIQSVNHTDTQSSRPASGKDSSFSSGSKTFSGNVGRGSYEGFLPPPQLRVGIIVGWHWLSWHSYRAEDWMLDFCLLWVHCPLPPPPTCVVVATRVPFLCLEKGTLELVDHPGPDF